MTDRPKDNKTREGSFKAIFAQEYKFKDKMVDDWEKQLNGIIYFIVYSDDWLQVSSDCFGLPSPNVLLWSSELLNYSTDDEQSLPKTGDQWQKVNKWLSKYVYLSILSIDLYLIW